MATVQREIPNAEFKMATGQREIPNTRFKMAAVQQKTRLARLFLESKSFVTVQRRFRLEYRNCRCSSKNSIKRWCEQLRSESFPHSSNNFV
ncbi:hypothetical protein AVEN_202005-1 [Araneus ventricosus]|uniref:DUF4817 domain-containing protein n=2 Tax=Araneus ventricosus TaxID=182803 RepID=A0A4Y2BDD6_ARAVE|nr:hypothetical protein AVEN_202005-1 [Araneus ventricosus]